MQQHDNSLESQRKKPKQARSKELVSSIFEATVRILPKVGSYQITTKKIAELAGVSIGSLYQYFPNKEALLGALMDFMMKELTEKAYRRIDELNGLPLDEFVSQFIDFTVDLFMTDKEKIGEIYRRAPELSRIPNLFELRREIVVRLAKQLRAHRSELSESDSIRLIFISVNSVLGVIQTMIYDPNQTYNKEELAIELKTMVKRYLMA